MPLHLILIAPGRISEKDCRSSEENSPSEYTLLFINLSFMGKYLVQRAFNFSADTL